MQADLPPHHIPTQQAPEQLPEAGEALGWRRELVSRARAGLGRIREHFNGGDHSAQQVDTLVGDIVTEATLGHVPSPEVLLVDTIGAEEIIAEEGDAPHTVEAMEHIPYDRLAAMLEVIDEAEGRPEVELVAATLLGTEAHEEDASHEQAEAFRELHSEMGALMQTDQEFIDKYKAGDADAIRLVKSASEMPIIPGGSWESLRVHSRAMTVLEAVHGEAIRWRGSQAVEDPQVAAYAENQMMPWMQFERKITAYRKEIMKPGFNAKERLALLERDFRQTVAYTLEVTGNTDPLNAIAAEYVFGSRQSFAHEVYTLPKGMTMTEAHQNIIGEKLATKNYTKSAQKYLENICSLGRENVQQIHEATNIANFDRYNIDQLDLALQFAKHDPDTIARLNKEGAQWMITGIDGDWNYSTSSISQLKTSHTIPFEVSREKGFKFVQTSLDARGLSNIDYGALWFHGAPGSITMAKGVTLTTAQSESGNGGQYSIAGSQSLLRLMSGIRPDTEGYRNMAMISCEGAVPVRGSQSVVDAMAGKLPMMRIMAADGYSFGEARDGDLYLGVGPSRASGHRQPGVRLQKLLHGSVKIDSNGREGGRAEGRRINPTVITSGTETRRGPRGSRGPADANGPPTYRTRREQASNSRTGIR